MSGLVVKAHRPWKTRVLLGLGAAAVVAAGWSLFEYGRYRAGFDHVAAAREYRALAAEKAALEQQLEALREQNAVLERAVQVERKAAADIKLSLQALQSEILELNEELAFYRGIVSPRQAARGLHLQSFKLTPAGHDGTYRYKVVLTQVLKNDRLAYGTVRLRLEGIQGGRPRSLDLSQVTEKGVKELKYRFKYFQDLHGELHLPDGFRLQRVTVQVRPRGGSRDMIEKTFDWETREQARHVGKEAQADGQN